MRIKKKFAILIIPFVFFLVSLFTLKDYGVNWDEPVHFMRGQGYLTYFLTGKTDVQELSSRPSFFQNPSLNAEYYLENDSGHPPLNGIMAAFSNLVFYQKLNILSDIDSYHLFNIASGTLMVLVVAVFAYQAYGIIPALISSLALSTYPLFFSESHFNIKDPPEAAFFAATILLFWLSLRKFNWKWLFLSAVAFAFSFSMKFNILFLPFILTPYLFVKYFGRFKKVLPKIPRSYFRTLLLSPVIIVGIFVGTWPYLWKKPLERFLEIVFYYADIGLGKIDFPNYTFAGLNLYPIYWILITTPPFLIILTLIGFIGIINEWKNKNKAAFLWFLWLLIPIVRVTLPGTSIYGGVRQIFEFIPAIALLSGFGAKVILDYVKPSMKKLATFILLVLFVPQIFTLVKLHPNENVYFNFIVGGLSGAVKRNIPSWGNSYGNAYWQSVKWLNVNVEEDAKLALVQGTGLNIPKVQLRSDIKFSNSNWTGIFRGGEYLTELTFNSGINPYPYAWEYVNKVLDPVYEVVAGGVPIAKVWKNDLEHTKEQYKKPEVRVWNYSVSRKSGEISVVFSKPVVLTRFYLHYSPSNICEGFSGEIKTSLDNVDWASEKEGIPNIQVTVNGLAENTSPFFFAARNLKYLKVTATDKGSCLFNGTYFDIWGLE